jgi:type I restriction enzyme R subunit
MHDNLITSIEFLKELLQMAKEVLEEEKKQNQPVDKRQKAKAALTELFESIRSKDTPIAVEAVVNDIDTQVVAIVRKFTDTFATLAGQNEVKRQLRSILWIKYKIKDNEVFEKAYKYIEMYY